MVNFGTSLTGSSFSRVTGTLSQSVILSNLQRNEDGLLLTQEQLSTGLRIVRPSIDPLGAQYSLNFQMRIEQNVQFQRTVQTTLGRLQSADSVLGQLKTLADRADQLGLEQANDTSTAQTRRFTSTEIDGLLRQAVNLANTRVAGRYLFGGSVTTTAPFSLNGDGVIYAGDESELNLRMADGLTIPSNLLGSEAYGAISDELRGLQDLDPIIVSGTKLTTLNRGEGVRLGSLLISDGVTPVTVDLTGAENAGDVLLRVNTALTQAGSTVVMDFNPSNNGFQLDTVPPGGNITVQEVLNGRTAADLGIVTPAAGSVAPVIGADLDPVVTPATRLIDLFGGVGLIASGITITNQTQGQTFTAALSFAGLTTVQDVLNTINNSGTFVRATINEDGTAIDVRSVLSGARLSIAENGGGTAAQMGLLYTFDRALLEDLNGGLGVSLVEGEDLQITLASGTSFRVDLSDSPTVADAVQAINDAAAAAGIPPAIFTAAANNANQNFVFTDNSVGAGTLTIQSLNGGFTARDLGIERASTAPPAAVVSGTALNPSGVQAHGIFTALIRLGQALQGDDVPGIHRALRILNEALDKMQDGRAEVGSRISRIELTKNRLEDDTDSTKKLLSNVQDIDLSEAASRFQMQQLILQTALSAASRILQTTLFNFI